MLNAMTTKKTSQKSSETPTSVPASIPAGGARAIHLRGACQHNLKSLDIDFPIHQLTVLCGVSGSGKSSLAFDTLYAEGQRRYIESFSAYTRQFLQRLDKPSFDSLEPLPPSVAVTRDIRGRNNRSTVGTASEILEYLRNVFAAQSKLYCDACQLEVVAHTPNTILDRLSGLPAARAMVGFDIHWKNAEELALLLSDLQASGYVRILAGDKTFNLGSSSREEMALSFEKVTTATVIVERLKWEGQPDERWSQAIGMAIDQSMAFDLSQTVLFWEPFDISSVPVETQSGWGASQSVDAKMFFVRRFSSQLRCDQCLREYPEATAALFNSNHPSGACPECEGFGEVIRIDPDKVVPDKSLTLEEGAIAPWRSPSYAHEIEELLALAPSVQLPVNIPVSELTEDHWKIIQHGVKAKKFGGLDGFFDWLERKKYKMHIRVFLSRWRSYSLCPACLGKRLSEQSLAYRLGGFNFAELCGLTIEALVKVLMETQTVQAYRNDKSILPRVDVSTASGIASVGAGNTSFSHSDLGTSGASNLWLAAESHSQYNASEPFRQVISRLEYLEKIGLKYVSLDRPMHTLSSGEAQRVNLTTLLGSTLVDMLYVFDEPTVGLHDLDVEKVAKAILNIRERGNTVILVEHEPHMIQLADRVLEIGPKAGELGGNVVFDGTPTELLASSTLTGKYLRGERPRPRQNRRTESFIELSGASGRNLKNVDLRIPAGCLTVVRGPSGAGKSSLILDTLVPACLLSKASEVSDEAIDKSNALPYRSIKGVREIHAVRAIDQSPIPRSVRSTPATYCKAMDSIREAFANTPEARARKFGPSHFSFNSDIGRCPTCEGIGSVNVEMQFMADVALPCGDCNGKRFKAEVLDVTYRDRNIDDVLNMSVSAANEFFRGEAELQSRLQLLLEIGLGYLPLGQNLSTLSAGESMRLKLASVLGETSRKSLKGRSKSVNFADMDSQLASKRELIVMDEPTTGLHFVDIDRLLDCLDVLLKKGHTIVVIEHNQQFAQAADYVVELGPEAGPEGGVILKQCFV